MPCLQAPIRLVLFDLGSTLIYERDQWDDYFPRADKALWNVLRSAGVTLEPGELYGDSPNFFAVYYNYHRGDLNEPTTAGVLDQLLQNKGYHLPAETLRRAVGAMFSVTQENWFPEQDAIETLASLKRAGLHIGLISNASDDDNTQALIDKGGFRQYLEYVISSATFGRRKPSPDIFQSALDHFKVPAQQAVMVGDDLDADIAGARGVGLQSIWITRRAYAAATRPAGIQPSCEVSSLAEIPGLLQQAAGPRTG